MKKFIPVLLTTLVLLPKVASADYSLHYAQAGALMAYADAEVRVLYGALSSKEFDPVLTKALVKELERTLSEVKRKLDRATTLLPEKSQKYEPEMQKLRQKVVKAENQLQRLATDIEEQTKGLDSEEEEIETEEEEAAVRDWDLLKKGTGWLAIDIQGVQSGYKRMASKLRVRPLPRPKKPRGRRPE